MVSTSSRATRTLSFVLAELEAAGNIGIYGILFVKKSVIPRIPIGCLSHLRVFGTKSYSHTRRVHFSVLVDKK